MVLDINQVIDWPYLQGRADAVQKMRPLDLVRQVRLRLDAWPQEAKDAP